MPKITLENSEFVLSAKGIERTLQSSREAAPVGKVVCNLIGGPYDGCTMTTSVHLTYFKIYAPIAANKNNAIGARYCYRHTDTFDDGTLIFKCTA